MAPLYKNHNLIVLLIILRVAARVLICWAGFHFFYDSGEPMTTSMSNEQKDYLRGVNMRNVIGLAAMNGRGDIYHDLNDQLRRPA